jgi:ribosomal protein L11 methyltransferase
MDYYKISVNISPLKEWLRDILSAQLAEAGFESFVETSTGMEAFIPAKNYKEADVSQVLHAFEKKHAFHVQKELIKSQNWNEVWEKNYFKPLVIGDRCIVRAPFHKNYPRLEYEIIIEPNMAFGTGNHETTSMMLEIVLENDFNERSVLDMGCGTGILSILAAKKGARKITAIDIDEWSFKGTKENAALNNVGNMDAKLGDASLLEGTKYDFILANIHKNILLKDLPVYSRCLNRGGLLFISGFYKEDIPSFIKKAKQEGLKETGRKTKNNWALLGFSNVY